MTFGRTVPPVGAAYHAAAHSASSVSSNHLYAIVLDVRVLGTGREAISLPVVSVLLR